MTEYVGQAPNEPEDPVSEETLYAWFDAIEHLIAEVPAAAQDSAPDDVEALPDATSTSA